MNASLAKLCLFCGEKIKINLRYFAAVKYAPKIVGSLENVTIEDENAPISRTQKLKAIEPSASTIQRLVFLGIERLKCTQEQQKLQRQKVFEEKIVM